MKAKNNKICEDCIDSNCKFRTSEGVKRNSPSDIIPSSLPEPPREEPSVLNSGVDKKNIMISSIRSIADRRIGSLLSCCLTCEGIMKSCGGYTRAEWTDIIRRGERNGEYDELYCYEPMLWE